MGLNVGATGASRPSAPRKSGGGFKWVLLLLLLIFGAGMYAGLYTARRVDSHPGFAQTVVDKLPGIPARTLPVVPALAVAPAPPSVPTPQPPVASAPSPEVTDHPSSPESKPVQTSAQAPVTNPNGEEENTSPTAPSQGNSNQFSADPTVQVQEYNSLLRRIQEAARVYESVREGMKTSTKEQKTSLQERQSAAQEEMVALGRQAQEKYDALLADPAVASRYVDKEPCLTSGQVPKDVTAVDLARLRFLRAK